MAKFYLSAVLIISKLISAMAASKDGSVRIYPNIDQNIRSISLPEIDGIITHFTGIESDENNHAALNDKAIINASSDIFNKPKANFLLSIEGIDSESLSDKISYTVSSANLLNSKDMAEYELDVAYKVAKAKNPDSMVVLLSNENNECKEGEYKPNVVRVVIKENDVTITGHPYNAARKAINNIQETEISKRFNELYKNADVFDEKKTADKLFMNEMVYIHDILSKIESKAKSLVDDDNNDFFGIVSDSAKQIYEKYGKDSKQYEAAKIIIKETVDDVVKQFQSMYDNGVAEVITTPISTLNKRMFKRANSNKNNNKTCGRPNNYSRFMTLEECNTMTNNCNGRGECKSESETNPGCFSCVCMKDAKTNVQYGGDSCEAEEISVKFNLLFWTSVFLIVSLIFIVGILFNIDSEIPMANVGHTKSD